MQILHFARCYGLEKRKTLLLNKDFILIFFFLVSFLLVVIIYCSLYYSG